MSVNDISSYINKVTQIINEQNNDSIIVYRGETQPFPCPCQPNIFRNNLLKNNKYFEKNLFDEMTANKITSGSSYLEKAIDAQHGGFPSRLLDVTYNSLVALYFATTPYFNKSEDAEDEFDGMVYIYSIDKLFCPSGENINNNYNSIINRNDEWICTESIFQKNHKLIDHIKLNNRIIAQQGALILFQGDTSSPISSTKYNSILIPKDSKPLIRNQLNVLFGIHTGFIYPEPSNLVTEISNKSNKINNIKFNLDSELNLVEYNLKLELTNFENAIIQIAIDSSISKKQLVLKVKDLEELIFNYKLGIQELLKHGKINNSHTFITNYNNLIINTIKNISIFLNTKNIGISIDEFYISQN